MAETEALELTGQCFEGATSQGTGNLRDFLYA